MQSYITQEQLEHIIEMKHVRRTHTHMHAPVYNHTHTYDQTHTHIHAHTLVQTDRQIELCSSNVDCYLQVMRIN